MQFVAKSNETVVCVPEYVVDAIHTLILGCDRKKIATIKMLRNLQFQPNYWANNVEGEMPHVLGLKDAKDLIEWVAKIRYITFV